MHNSLLARSGSSVRNRGSLIVASLSGVCFRTRERHFHPTPRPTVGQAGKSRSRSDQNKCSMFIVRCLRLRGNCTAHLRRLQKAILEVKNFQTENDKEQKCHDQNTNERLTATASHGLLQAGRKHWYNSFPRQSQPRAAR